MQEVSWKLEHILRYLLIFILGFGPLLILIKNSRFNEFKVDKHFIKLPVIYFFLIPIFISFIMMVIAVDSGRWIHISYTCTFITYFTMLKNQIILQDLGSLPLYRAIEKTSNYYENILKLNITQ